MNIAIAENVFHVGKIDWELRHFHGQEYSTHRGSSYNAYLVKDERTALIDTVWTPFAREFVENLEATVGLKNIDSIVANHAEPDHSGAMPALMEAIPETPIYCTANAVKSLKGHYHKDWDFHPVKTGDKLSLGKRELIFVQAAMLHWPDTMFSYLTGSNILFSNDAFGQHLASELLYNDLVDPCELHQECLKYYANILTPFSALAAKKIDEILAMGLPLSMICPSHGVLWRKDPLGIVGLYLQWANGYQEDQITVLYDTMWNATRKMAEAVGEGLSEAAPWTRVKLFNVARSDKNDVIAEVFKSRALVLGSPTVNKGVLSAVAGLLEEIRGLGFKDKKAAAFGSYGWSGEGVKVLTERLREAGFEIVHEGLRELWQPDGTSLERCRAFGRELASRLA